MLALEGIRVLDLTHALAGPFCTQQFQLLGADVVKIEPPGSGDDFRERPAVFAAMNAGKRSIVLDLKSNDGSAAVRRLVERADVAGRKLRPGVARSLGVDWETLAPLNPRLIYCSISGYGQSGPLREYPAIEWAVQAMSGMSAGYIADDVDGAYLGRGRARSVQWLRRVFRDSRRAAPAPADGTRSARRRGHARRGDVADGAPRRRALSGRRAGLRPGAARQWSAIAPATGACSSPRCIASGSSAVPPHRRARADRRPPLCRPGRPGATRRRVDRGHRSPACRGAPPRSGKRSWCAAASRPVWCGRSKKCSRIRIWPSAAHWLKSTCRISSAPQRLLAVVSALRTINPGFRVRCRDWANTPTRSSPSSGRNCYHTRS